MLPPKYAPITVELPAGVELIQQPYQRLWAIRWVAEDCTPLHYSWFPSQEAAVEAWRLQGNQINDALGQKRWSK